MIHAYSELYLTGACRIMAALFDSALGTMTPSEFAGLFLDSTVAVSWEAGNPKYIAGKSGEEILEEITGRNLVVSTQPKDRSASYWCGHVYAYAQWYFGCRFAELFSAIPIEELLPLYTPLHEADISKTMNTFRRRLFPQPALKTWREKRNLSQSQLARISSVSLRSIKAYEQGDLDISKAGYETLWNLSRSLCCEVRELIS